MFAHLENFGADRFCAHLRRAKPSGMFYPPKVHTFCRIVHRKACSVFSIRASPQPRVELFAKVPILRVFGYGRIACCKGSIPSLLSRKPRSTTSNSPVTVTRPSSVNPTRCFSRKEVPTNTKPTLRLRSLSKTSSPVAKQAARPRTLRPRSTLQQKVPSKKRGQLRNKSRDKINTAGQSRVKTSKQQPLPSAADRAQPIHHQLSGAGSGSEIMHLSKRYGLDRSCDSLSRARVSEACASLHALWIWYTRKQFLPTLLPKFVGSSMKRGSKLPQAGSNKIKQNQVI